MVRLVENESMGQIEVIRLARPQVLNALNGQMIADLHESLAASTARVVILSGQGSSFCSGGDRRDGIGIDGDVHTSITRLQQITAMLRSPGRVALCAVEGWAVGGGLELAVACDLVISSRTGRFRLPDVAIGAGLTGGSTWLLPRIVGVNRFVSLVLGEVELDAETASEWGIVTRVVEAGQAEREAIALARRVAAMPLDAVSAFKQVAGRSLESPLEQALADEAQSVARILESSKTFHFS